MSKCTLDSLLAKATLEQLSQEFLRGRSPFVRKSDGTSTTMIDGIMMSL